VRAACTVEEEVCSVFWWGDLRERDLLEDLGIDGRILKIDLQEMG